MKYLLTSCLILLVPAVQAADVSMNAGQIDALGIETAQATPVDNVAGHAYPARVRVPPANETVLAAPVDGLVKQVAVAEGEEVTRGQSLITLASPGLVERQRDYLDALASHRVAAQALERDQALSAEGIIAERRLDETRGAYNRSRSRLDALEQSLSLAGMSESAIAQLRKTRSVDAQLSLTAPLDGTVMEMMATAGERLDAASPLVRISTLDTLWLEVSLPVERLGSVAVGSRVEVVDPSLTADVILIGSRIDPEDQTILIRAKTDDHGGRLRPGQFLRVRIEAEAVAGLVQVPSSAVVRQADGFFVFIATEDGFDALPVERLGQSEDRVTVRALEGELTSSSQVASEGVAAIKGAWQGMGGGE